MLFKKNLFKSFLIFNFIVTSNLFAESEQKYSSFNIENHQLKTIYVYNFLKNIEWSNDKKLYAYSLLIITDNLNLKNAFESLSNKKQVHNKPILVDFKTSIDEVDLSKYQLIFIDEKFKSQNSKALSNNGKNKTLIVTFNSEEKSLIMLNFYYSLDNRLLFELNRANLLNNGLTASDEIILLGGREIDVAEIYKNLKTSMTDLEKSLNKMKLDRNKQESEIKNKNLEIEKKLKYINELNVNLAKAKEESQKQQELINESKKTFLIQQESVKQQQKELEKQTKLIQEEFKKRELVLTQTIQQHEKELEESKNNLLKSKNDIEKAKNDIQKTQNDMKDIVEIYNSKQEYLKELDLKIGLMEKNLKIIEQEITRVNSENTRLSNSLIMSVVFIIIGVLFVVKISRARKVIELQAIKLKEQNNQIEIKNESLREVNLYLKQSIEYASYIQQSIIPDPAILSRYFSESFVMWEPKDQVGGDIFFFEQISQTEVLVIIADCTSHGVPGAFITILVKAVEKQLINEIKYGRVKASSPADMLSYFNQELKHILKQFDNSSKSNVGFDGGILYYNSEFKVMTYSGAQTPLYYLDNNEMKITKYDRQSVGYSTSNHTYKFNHHTFSAEFVTKVYLVSDGFYDQVGGNEKMMYGKKRLGRTLESIQNMKFQEQKIYLKEHLENYQGHETRRDDITLIGLKV